MQIRCIMEDTYDLEGDHTRSSLPWNQLVFLMAMILPACTVFAQAQTMDPPKQRWSTYVGGIGEDQVLSVAVDDSRYLYAAGRTSDSLLLGNDTTGNSGFTHQRYYGGGGSDAFLAKYASHGALLWCTYFGGAGDDEAVQVVVNGTDEVYLVGNTTSVDSIATDTLSYQGVPGGGTDMFVARFSQDGLLLGATYFGGPAEERATGAALDAWGRLVVCGHADAAGAFNSDVPPHQPWTAGSDGLVLLFDGTEELLAGSYLGGEGDDRLLQVAQGDSTGIVLIGNTNSTTGIATAGAMTTEPQGGMDAFLIKLDSSLVVQHGTYFGGPGDDTGSSVAARNGLLIIGGSTMSTDLYTTPLSHQPESASGEDGFLAALAPDLTVQWCTFIGDTGQDALASVFIDDQDAFYVAGTTTSNANLSTSTDTTGAVLAGAKDAFLMRFSNTGSLDWSRYVGAMSDEEAHAMTVKQHTGIYLGGRTSSITGFTDNPHQSDFGGGTWDGFALRLDQKISSPPGGISTCSGGGGGGGGGTGGSGGPGGVNPPQNNYHVCLGDSIMFVAYSGSLGFDSDWMWYADSCGVNTQFITKGDTIVLYPDHSFTLFVRAEGSDHATTCSYANIIVHEMPEPVAFASDTVCAGAPIQLHGGGAETFAWLVADSVMATGSQAQITAPMTAGVFHIVAAGTNGPACTVNVDLFVEVLPAPDVAWQVTHISCEGEPGMIQLSMPDTSITDPDQLTFLWQPDTLQGSDIAGLQAGEYTVVVTDTLLGCSRTDSIVVQKPLTLDVDWEVTPITCAGAFGSIQLLLPDTAGLDSLLTIAWSMNNLHGPFVSGPAVGNYAVLVTDTMGCARADTLRLPVPPFSMATWQITGTTCADGDDGSIALVHPDLALSDTAFLSITWAFPELQGPVVTGLEAGGYVVTVTDTLGCSRTDSLVVPMAPPLIDNVVTTYAYCGASTGSAQVQSSSSSPGLAFDFGNGTSPSTLAEHLLPGNYTVIATDSTGCQEVAAFTIQSFGIISVDIPSDTVLAENGSALLECFITPPDNQAIYQWTPTAGLSNPVGSSTTCQVTDTTTYIIQAISQVGCSAFDTVVVVPRFPEPPTIAPPCGDFFLPDHFSPNGDRQNDMLCIMGGCLTELQWNIHDRWGGPVFSTTAPDACWDGTHRGAVLPAGTYVYTLRVKRSNGEELQRTGTITLMR